MKKFLAIIIAIIFVMSLVSCNVQIVDTTFKFDRAIISLPNGQVIEGKVDTWRDYEDSDMIQIKIDGVTYLTFMSNVCLIAE